MYANKLAVAVKHRGKALQEFGEVVYLPFGSEYGLLIKNLNSVRASVKVSIDGQDVTEGVNLVVPPNSSIDLERFIKNGNLNAGNRFKFIERTAQVAAHRGARVDDGLIKVSFAFEVVRQHVYHTPYQPTIYKPDPGWWSKQGTTGGWVNTSGGASAQSSAPSASFSASGSLKSATRGVEAWAGDQVVTPQNTAGITAPGSVSHQQFQPVGWFETEPVETVMIIQLSGQSYDSGAVQKVVYTRTKIECSVCGASHKPLSKFCSQCGASLIVI